jgi:hypothetical protein
MWYPGKNLINAIGNGLGRNRDLKTRGLNDPPPQYSPQGLAAFGGTAQAGAAGFGAAQGAQNNALGMYADMAAGNGPSVAEQQMRAGADQAVANQMTLAAQGTGGNLGSQMRTAQDAGAATALQTNQQAGQLRAGEQQAAMQGLAGLSSTMASQNLQREATGLGLMGNAYGQQLAAETQSQLGNRGLDLEQLQGNRGFGLGILQGLTGAAGTGAAIGMMSDERVKTGEAPSAGAATEAARAARPSKFEYEPGAGPPGERVGVIAQGLASTPAGRATVVPTEKGLALDVGQLSGLTLAGLAETIMRVDALEKKFGPKKKKPAKGGSRGKDRSAEDRP